jgi:hypothetical protein
MYWSFMFRAYGGPESKLMVYTDCGHDIGQDNF